jgi:DNA-binding XRE family transcriptional regulator
MTFGEVEEYVRALEQEIQELRRKTDNRKKFSPPEVSRIRVMWEKGRHTQADLAWAFDCNRATISRIVRGKYYPALNMRTEGNRSA